MTDNKSDVAKTVRQIDLEHEGAYRGLTGFASGVAKHDFIEARAERGAEMILQLLNAGNHEQAFKLWESKTWGIEEEGEILACRTTNLQ